jgi:hypothetical protein
MCFVTSIQFCNSATSRILPARGSDGTPFEVNSRRLWIHGGGNPKIERVSRNELVVALRLNKGIIYLSELGRFVPVLRLIRGEQFKKFNSISILGIVLLTELVISENQQSPLGDKLVIRSRLDRGLHFGNDSVTSSPCNRFMPAGGYY